jgi:hypothetical protein
VQGLGQDLWYLLNHSFRCILTQVTASISGAATFSITTLSIMQSIEMLSVIYAGCHIQTLYAECHYAECRSAQLRQLLPPTGMSRGDAFAFTLCKPNIDCNSFFKNFHQSTFYPQMTAVMRKMNTVNCLS